MSVRADIDKEHQITNQGILVGQCAVIRGVWVFLMDGVYFPYLETQQNLHRVHCAPDLVKFIDEQLALRNVALRLKS